AREWAMSHISPSESSKKLSAHLKEIELSEGRQWTEDLFVKVNRPELLYLHPKNNWLLEKREAFLMLFSQTDNEQAIIDFINELSATMKAV
ncbi:MAG: hypothetical protein OEZ58_17350, partial [Gammaproteobacteria bacterium]|nr:hypothetical protein [Gammaproteobacteria bacterium]